VGEERRTISVLFVDIVGFTGIARRLDPADLRILQREYFRAVTEVVRSCGGVVEKYVGDAVLALFGAPHSDGRAPGRSAPACGSRSSSGAAASTAAGRSRYGSASRPARRSSTSRRSTTTARPS
jgi:class 3 adenylate cyclase